jgi:hypothetical protein
MLDDTTVINVPDTADYIPIARPVMGPNDELIYNPYIGTFNGNGGTINIELSGSASYLALFGANNGMIQNLTVGGTVTAEIDKNNPKDIDYVAGVVAYNDIGGTIERVITKITITADDSYVDPATKEEFSIHSIGGIAGFNGWDQYSPDSPHYTSQKLDTFQPGGYIHQCRNEGIAEPAPEEPDEGVIIGGQNKIGGIAGENAWKITECSNWGRIKCVKSGELHPRWPGVGGIAGRNGNNNTATEQGDIESCYNRGTIIDQTDKNIDHDDYGGITGWCDEDSTVKSCYTSGPFEQYAEDPEQPGMYIIQPATGSKNPIIGSIDEDVTTMTDNNNYALDTISTGDSKDPILIGIPKKCCEMTKPEFVTLLNGGPSGPYVQNTTEAPCYPKLAWEVPPPVSGEQQT